MHASTIYLTAVLLVTTASQACTPGWPDPSVCLDWAFEQRLSHLSELRQSQWSCSKLWLNVRKSEKVEPDSAFCITYNSATVWFFSHYFCFAHGSFHLKSFHFWNTFWSTSNNLPNNMLLSKVWTYEMIDVKWYQIFLMFEYEYLKNYWR